MPAYIRSKISNTDFTDVVLEAENSTVKLRQDGTFKLPVASGPSVDTPVGSIRYNDQIEKIEYKSITGWKSLDEVSENLASMTYVDNAINNLALVARTGQFLDLLNIPDLATKLYVDTSISNLVGGAPDLLNTLNEISSALNNDPDFYNNIVLQISSKLPLAGGTLTGPLYLSGIPTLSNQAATKEYVDNLTAGITVYSTDDVPEGSLNLYYTDARATDAARLALSAGTGVTYNSATGSISIGQDVSTSSNVTFNKVTAGTVATEQLEITSTGDYTISSATNIVLDTDMEVLVKSPLTFSSYTTTELNDLLVQDGTVVYDRTTNKLKVYLTPGGWTDIVSGVVSVPTLLSQLTNDVGFITTESDAQTLSITDNILSISGGNSVTLPEGATVTINPTVPPGVIKQGDLWWNNTDGHPYIYYDGTWISFTPSTNQFSGDYNDLANKPVLVGKQSIAVTAGSMTATSTAGCSELATLALGADQPDMVVLLFDDTIKQHAQFSLAMPRSWDEGTVTFKAYWSHETAVDNFDVVWGLQAVAVSNLDSIAATYGTAQTVTQTGGVADTLYVTSESAPITIAGSPAAEDMVFFRIFRKADDLADTLGVSARLHGIALFITTDATTDQ